MGIPFTREQFFAVFADYNVTVWPAQLALMVLAIALVVAAHRHRPPTRWIAAGLSFLWIWMAAVYHAGFFTTINRAAYGFAVLFAVEAGLIAWYGVRTSRIEINARAAQGGRLLGWMLVVYAMLLYPAVAYLAGQRYPAVPTYGLPCPTTIFTLGILAWTVRPVPWLLLIIPVAWSIVATSAALTLGVPEDFALPVAAVALLLKRLRQAGKSGAQALGAPGIAR